MNFLSLSLSFSLSLTPIGFDLISYSMSTAKVFHFISIVSLWTIFFFSFAAISSDALVCCFTFIIFIFTMSFRVTPASVECVIIGILFWEPSKHIFGIYFNMGNFYSSSFNRQKLQKSALYRRNRCCYLIFWARFKCTQQYQKCHSFLWKLQSNIINTIIISHGPTHLDDEMCLLW